MKIPEILEPPYSR